MNRPEVIRPILLNDGTTNEEFSERYMSPSRDPWHVPGSDIIAPSKWGDSAWTTPDDKVFDSAWLPLAYMLVGAALSSCMIALYLSMVQP
jgi:hypothetical protein